MPGGGGGGRPPRLLTVSTTLNPGVVNYRETLTRTGWLPNYATILGEGQQWRGWRWRMAIYADACAALDPAQLVILTDASDVFALRTPNDFAELWGANFEGARIVWGAELGEGCAPSTCTRTPQWLAVQFGGGHVPLRNINGGLLAGTASAVEEMFRWQLAHGFTDDQRGAGAYVEAMAAAGASGGLLLDTTSKLFANAFNGMTFDYHTDALGIARVTPISNGAFSTACFVHFPGLDWEIGIERLVGKKSSYERVGEKLLAHNFIVPTPAKVWILATAAFTLCTGLLIMLGIALARDAHAHILAVSVALTCSAGALCLTWIRRAHNPS